MTDFERRRDIVALHEEHFGPRRYGEEPLDFQKAEELVAKLAEERGLPPPRVEPMPRRMRKGAGTTTRAAYSVSEHALYLGSTFDRAETTRAVTHELEHALQSLYIAAAAVAGRPITLDVAPELCQAAEARGLHQSEMAVNLGVMLDRSMKRSIESRIAWIEGSMAGEMSYNNSLVELCARVAEYEFIGKECRDVAASFHRDREEVLATTKPWNFFIKLPQALALLHKERQVLAAAEFADQVVQVKVERIASKYESADDPDVRGS